MARPIKVLDWDRVEWLLKCGCTGVDIAAEFDMHPKTFYDKVLEEYKMCFTEVCALKRTQGQNLLREAQLTKALEKDNTMMIWLGKQLLGQRENVSELKDMVAHELRAGIRQLSKESRGEAASEPEVAPEPPVQNSH